MDSDTTTSAGEHQARVDAFDDSAPAPLTTDKPALDSSSAEGGAKQHDDVKSMQSPTDATPELQVTFEQSHNSTVELTTSSIVSSAPSARTFSPSPLLWSDGGWHAGHFAFDQGDEVKIESERTEGGAENEGPPPNKGKRANGEDAAEEQNSSVAGSSGSSVDGNHKDEATPRLKSATIPHKSLRSALTPTAAPFIFQPKSSSSDTGSTRAPLPPLSLHLEPLVTSFPTSSSAMGSHDFYPSPTKSSYADSAFDYLQNEQETDWRLDDEGHLVQIGGGDRYAIAEEILQLQSTDAAPTTASMGYGGRVHTKLPSYYDQGRRASESSAGSASSSFSYPRPQPPQIPFPSMSPFASSTPPTADRSCTSSMSSQHSYFSPRPSSTYDFSPSSAQLQSYFGPSSVNVNSPYANACDLAVSSVPPSPSPLRDLPPHYGLHHSASCSSLSSLGYQTDPEDILYQEARETFIQNSFASLASTPTAANCQAMTAHFDRAMHSPFPLATLYGMTPEAAAQLAADPARSGVADNVLKLALIRGQQQRLAGAAGLGGPSANNRKLGLYKTELCRSWEEKGSCRYGAKCQFAHGQHEVREVARHPKFKSEVCRTFWLHGSCPYGRRCCFIHTTVPGGAAAAPSANAESLAPSSTALTSSAPSANGDPVSRIAHRITSTSSLASAASTNGGRGFGPNLSSYLGPTSSPKSLSPTSSYHSSPVEPFRHDFGNSSIAFGGSNSSTGALSGSLFESSGSFIGVGLKAPGRFTTNPAEVPPTYQDPPKSRLERLANLSNPSTPRSHSSNDLASQFFGAGAFGNGSSSGGLGLSFGSSATVPSTTAAQHSRHSSQSSFSSVGSTSSAGSLLGFPRMASSSYSPFLPRTDSGSSLSSLGGSPFATFAPLQPAGGDWLGSDSSASKKASALDWDCDLTITESTQEYIPSHSSDSTDDSYGLGSLSIDRSADETPTPIQ